MSKSLFIVALCSAALALGGKHAGSQESMIPSVVWRLKEESPTTGLSNPHVSKNEVFVGNDLGLVRALRSTDGKELWTFQYSERIHSRAASDNDCVYLTSSKGVVTLSRETGKLIWENRIEHGAGDCIVQPSTNLLIVGGNDGFMYAFDNKTGAQRWRTNIVSDAPPDPVGFPGEQARIQSSLARPTGITCDEEGVYQSIFDQSRVVAIDAANGKVIWSYQANGWIFGAPTADRDNIVFGSQDNCLHCLNRRTGERRWKFETRGRIESSATLDDRFIYFASCDGNVYCLHRENGQEAWRFETEPDETGRRPIYSKPVLRNGLLYFGTGAGQVIALDSATGDQILKLRPSKLSHIFSDLATDGRQFFVTTRQNWKGEGESSLVAIGFIRQP